MTSLTKILSTYLLPLSACIFGYALWLAVSMHRPIILKLSVPLCLKEEEERSVDAPEDIVAYISTKRKDAHAHDILHTIAYLDTTHYPDGTHEIELTKKNMFLPKSINLVKLNPSTISITLTSNK